MLLSFCFVLEDRTFTGLFEGFAGKFQGLQYCNISMSVRFKQQASNAILSAITFSGQSKSVSTFFSSSPPLSEEQEVKIFADLKARLL